MFLCMLVVCVSGFFYGLEVETKWSKSVIAADHGAHGILHPVVIEVAFALCQLFDEVLHACPCGWA